MSDIVPAFFLDSFRASVPGSTNPVTEFDNGADIQLTWQSNGTSFTVYAAQDAQPVYQGTAPTCVVRGRTRATTFILAASVTGGPQGGTPYPDFETIYLYDALTVTIKNPDETPKSLTAGTMTVSGASNLRGDATLGNARAGTLTVTGASDLKGGLTATGLTVTGQATLGNTTLGSATVSNSLGVTGPTALAAATVGTLTVTGSVTMMAPRTISAGPWYTASTDGILVGTVWYPSDAGKKCSAIISGYADGIGWVRATGGNTVVWQNSFGSIMWSNANTFSVPVRRGTSFAANVQQIHPDKDVDAPTGFWWVPFGRNATLTELSQAEADALGLEPPELPPPVGPAYDPTTAIAELIGVIRDLAGGELPAGVDEQLTSALYSLVTHQP